MGEAKAKLFIAKASTPLGITFKSKRKPQMTDKGRIVFASENAEFFWNFGSIYFKSLIYRTSSTL